MIGYKPPMSAAIDGIFDVCQGPIILGWNVFWVQFRLIFSSFLSFFGISVIFLFCTWLSVQQQKYHEHTLSSTHLLLLLHRCYTVQRANIKNAVSVKICVVHRCFYQQMLTFFFRCVLLLPCLLWFVTANRKCHSYSMWYGWLMLLRPKTFR